MDGAGAGVAVLPLLEGATGDAAEGLAGDDVAEALALAVAAGGRAVGPEAPLAGDAVHGAGDVVAGLGLREGAEVALDAAEAALGEDGAGAGARGLAAGWAVAPGGPLVVGAVLGAGAAAADAPLLRLAALPAAVLGLDEDVADALPPPVAAVSRAVGPVGPLGHLAVDGAGARAARLPLLQGPALATAELGTGLSKEGRVSERRERRKRRRRERTMMLRRR